MINKPATIQVIVDCQLLQTSDRHRGMGKYLYSLLTAMPELQNKADIQWVFLVNESLPELLSEDKRAITDLNGTTLAVPLLSHVDKSEFVEAADTNRQRLDDALQAFWERSKKADKVVFFIPAQFSSEIYPVYPTSGTANVMLFHDVIPFLYYKQYFQDHEAKPRREYSQRFREVYKTDIFVANSQTTADDLTIYFGVDPTRVVAILGAGADRSSLEPAKPDLANSIMGDFVLMPSGDDYRKNNLVAVTAFAALNTDTKLVITSKFSQGTQRALQEACSNIVFAGAVSDEEYLWLLDNARCTLFPTEYEGLGMPALEAIERDGIVACSDIPVFLEISQDAFFTFNPSSPTSMTETLKKVLSLKPDSAEIKQKQKHYKNILKTFTWNNTAKAFDKVLREVHPSGPKKKLAIFCPSPASYSAVGKYAFEVHAELSCLYDIDYYAEEGLTSFDPTRPNILEFAAGYYPATEYANRQHLYDQVLYNVGNSEFHIETILNALRNPANAIIHDTHLNGIFDYMTRNGFMPNERREFESLLDRKLDCKDSSCVTSIVNNQRRVIVHSAYAGRALQAVNLGLDERVAQVFHPIGVPQVMTTHPAMAVVSFAGIISEDKGINLVADVSSLPSVNVKVFGFGVLGDSPLLQQTKSNVEIITDLTDKEFQDNLRATDILVNYRIKYNGETSRSTLEAMRYGAVVIVKDVGWYGELPDDTVVKISSESEVLGAIKNLLDNPDLRTQIGTAARKYLAKEYTFRKYAERLAENLEGNR